MVGLWRRDWGQKRKHPSIFNERSSRRTTGFACPLDRALMHGWQTTAPFPSLRPRVIRAARYRQLALLEPDKVVQDLTPTFR
jgi:hypothetical protein